jgi:TetR/AcrR family transcriptional regulator, transcriptional repressor for nem operon
MVSRDSEGTRRKLLDAARDVIRRKGYAATTVDDVCKAAGVTKGGFFHHFQSKEDLGVAALEAFNDMADQLFTSAPYNTLEDPRERLHGYIDLREALLDGELWEFTCLLGTTVQEVYASHPRLREAAAAGMDAHVDMLERDIAAARERYAPEAQWSPRSLAYFMQSVLQGAFIFAKASQGPQLARESLDHLRRYLSQLLGPAESSNQPPRKEQFK